MAQTFPYPIATFYDKLRLSGMKLNPQYMQDTSGTGGGDIYAVDLGPAPWAGEAQIGILTPVQTAELQALFDRLDGSINDFYMCHPFFHYPFSDPKGVVLDAWATGGNTIKLNSVAGNNKDITIKDAPPNFVFPAGTFFHFDFGSSPVHRAFHRLSHAVTASAGGLTPTVEVRPHIRPGFALNAVLEFRKPCFQAKVVPQSYDSGQSETLIQSGMGFAFRQVI